MSTNSIELSEDSANSCYAREWMGGFLLAGLLLGLFGALLIAWQYHIDTNPQLIGLHFLAVNAGYVFGAAISQWLLHRVPIRFVALAACSISFASLAALCFVVPPAPAVWRILGLGFIGLAAGSLVTALLYALEPLFTQSPAASIARAGALFVCGSLISTAMVAITYFAGSVQIETGLLALVPLIYFAIYAANKHPAALRRVQQREPESALRETLKDLRRVAAVLFSLLLFFQFGNEWAIAGWLPLFLIQRLGINPVWAISALAVYFLALICGRLLTQPLLPRISHRELLIMASIFAMCGYLLLSVTPVMEGVWIAVALIGVGFAPIYPLVAECLDERFSYHPGFYNRIFTIAITGGMCAPWFLGYVDEYLGVKFVMLLPAIGSALVLVLALLIMLEAHLMRGSKHGTGEKEMTAALGTQ